MIMRLEKGEAAPVPRVPDPDHRIDRRYGVESSWSGFLKVALRGGALTKATTRGFPAGALDDHKHHIPADFLIGRDLTIDRAYFGQDLGDHLPLRDTRLWLQLAATGKDDPADDG
jgi:hypothetical protein